MRALSISPEKLLTMIIGQPITLDISYAGQLLLASTVHQQPNLPSEMAGALAEVSDTGQVKFITLVHPFKVINRDELFNIDESNIHREPYNWFGPQALVIEKKCRTSSTVMTAPLLRMVRFLANTSPITLLNQLFYQTNIGKTTLHLSMTLMVTSRSKSNQYLKSYKQKSNSDENRHCFFLCFSFMHR